MVRFLISVVMVLLLIANSIRAEENVQRDDSIAELKIFDKYIGEWTFRTKSNLKVTSGDGDVLADITGTSTRK